MVKPMAICWIVKSLRWKICRVVYCSSDCHINNTYVMLITNAIFFKKNLSISTLSLCKNNSLLTIIILSVSQIIISYKVNNIKITLLIFHATKIIGSELYGIHQRCIWFLLMNPYNFFISYCLFFIFYFVQETVEPTFLSNILH